MRTIKFRCWDGKIKVMIPNITLSGLKNWENVNYYEWMQYTSLKDKNGKEIYEGDILEQKTDDGKIHQAIILTWDFRSLAMLEDQQGDWEIIGNIYSNPELLQ